MVNGQIEVYLDPIQPGPQATRAFAEVKGSMEQSQYQGIVYFSWNCLDPSGMRWWCQFLDCILDGRKQALVAVPFRLKQLYRDLHEPVRSPDFKLVFSTATHPDYKTRPQQLCKRFFSTGHRQP
jgi:hypothetical protein